MEKLSILQQVPSFVGDGIKGWLEITIDAGGPDPEARLRKYYLSAAIPYPHTYSNLPLGNVAYSARGDGSRVVRTHDGERILQVSISYSAERSGSGYRWKRDDPEGDVQRVEGIARYLTGRQAYHASIAGAPLMLAGRRVGTRVVRGRSEPWVAIQDWAQARGATLRVNERRGTAQLAVYGTNVIVPLGARAIKVGSSWVDLPGPVAWWDSGWFVPLGALP